jgi:hypothetical protein
VTIFQKEASNIKSLRTDAGSAAFPFFGRLRRGDYENVVKRLMGEPRPDPILIPAVLTTDEELPHAATDFMTAGSSLQRGKDLKSNTKDQTILHEQITRVCQDPCRQLLGF